MPFIEKKKGEIGFIKITLLLILIVILNLIGNIIRGLTLIVFRIMPEYWFHDAVGLLVLLLYVLIPFYFIASKVICHVPVKIKKERILPGNIKYIVLLCCTTITIFLCQRLPEIDPVILSENYLTLEGYETEQVTPDVTKLWNDETLIYVKAPIPPYRTDHNPMICWKGSGYSFSKVDHFKLGGHHVIYSELVKGKEKLYTTWWFQSDKSIAVDQWGWRRKSIKTGESFYLVNITCNSMETLKEKSLGIMREELFGSIK
jgi:exosortase N